MNIIFFTKNIGPDALYHWNIVDTFTKLYNVHLDGPGFSGYFPGKHINNIIKDSGFRPDLIVFGTAQALYNCVVPGLEDIKIPKLIFLNKEFIGIGGKLAYIRRYKFDLVSTILNKDTHKPFEDECSGIPFIQIPHGIDPTRFRPLDIEKKYDFGFLGALTISNTELIERSKIKDLLFKQTDLSDRYKILWGDNVNGLLFKGDDYIKALNSCKMFLSTLSPMGIISTRFYELSACRTMIICPRAEYDGDFIDKETVVMYDDNKDFVEKFLYYLENEDDRNAIAWRAYRNVLDYHTWDARIKKLMGHIFDEHGECMLVN